MFNKHAYNIQTNPHGAKKIQYLLSIYEYRNQKVGRNTFSWQPSGEHLVSVFLRNIRYCPDKNRG